MPEFPVDDAGNVLLVLDSLGNELDPSILIGGWATFFRVGGATSHDIDLIIGSPEVRDKVKASVSGISESRHLQGRKWRGDRDGVHVDIYLPHESQLGGKLRLKVEVLAEYTDLVGHGRWRLLTVEAHTISKFAALLDRPDSEKGSKDATEIVALLEQGVDPAIAAHILVAATAGPVEDLPNHVATTFELLMKLAGLNKGQRRVFDRMRREWATAIADAVSPTKRERPPLE